jgi:hypothetical protein
MHPDHAVGSRGRTCDLRDGERGRVARKDCFRPANALELCEQLPLRPELLDDRLDHDVAIRERRDLRGQAQQPDVERVDLSLIDLAREEVLDAAARLPSELVGHLAPDRLEARLDRELRNARAHRPEADDSDLHAPEPNDGLEAELVEDALERCLD